MNRWKKWEIGEIFKNDPLFPSELRKIPDCPKKLYFRGNWNPMLFSKTLGVVGSRRMTKYATDVMAKFMPDLVANNITIVSGFMYGVDSDAHKTCLELGGKTIAVLGSGLDFLTPSENDDLYAKILENDGLVISEYEPNFKPTLWSFPQRNRIVSGISTVGILIVEAGIKSGSLITARIGVKQHKKIFAVPGPITSTASAGTNWLIQEDMAKIAINPLEILGRRQVAGQMELLDDTLINFDYKKILEVLYREPMTIDELAREINKKIPETSILVSQMMMKEMIEDDGGKLYALLIKNPLNYTKGG